MLRATDLRRLPPNLRFIEPALKGYALAYALVVAPRVLALLVAFCRQRKARLATFTTITATLKRPLTLDSFPSFCGLLLSSFGLLDILLQKCVLRILSFPGQRSSRDPGPPTVRLSSFHVRSCRFIAGLVSAWTLIPSLAFRKTRHTKSISTTDISKKGEHHDKTHGELEMMPPRAGKTMDLTLFLLVRAADTLSCSFRKTRPEAQVKRRFDAFGFADELLFAFSSGMIMWSWFYHPERLPQSYNNWIDRAAVVDSRLIRALREARAGTFVYGKDLGEKARFLQSMCKEYGWPLSWGDPAHMRRISCEMVHMGCGPNCHWHAISRFTRAFRFAILTNLPLQLLVKGLARTRSWKKLLVDAGRDAGRSSAFLAAFVTLMYYGICLSRTLVGPRIFSSEKVSPQMWDSGLCVDFACAICGSSIFIENKKRRPELALFVAPRALGTILPRSYDSKNFWLERSVFALSTAYLLTVSTESSHMVRGSIGRLMGMILHRGPIKQA